MHLRTFTPALLVLALFQPLSAAPVAAEKLDADSILREADVALAEVEQVVYRVEYYELDTRAGASGGAPLTGEVRLVRAPEDTVFGGRIFVRSSLVPSPTALDRERVIATWNGEEAFLLRFPARTPEKAPADRARELFGVSAKLLLDAFLVAEPLADSGASRFDGTAAVGPTHCLVVSVDHGGGESSRWFFGSLDKLPRRYEHRLAGEGGEFLSVLTITGLNTKAQIGEDDFTLGAPAKRAAPLAARPPSGLLPVGSEAPSWTLADQSGKKHTLHENRGKVVVLDFWATWCGPCKLAMPGIERLRKKYSRDDVAIFGVSFNDNGDPKAYMKSMGYTYDLLVKGVRVARDYRVRGIPAFYVIGPDGAVLQNFVGFDPKADERISALIDEALASR